MRPGPFRAGVHSRTHAPACVCWNRVLHEAGSGAEPPFVHAALLQEKGGDAADWTLDKAGQVGAATADKAQDLGAKVGNTLRAWSGCVAVHEGSAGLHALTRCHSAWQVAPRVGRPDSGQAGGRHLLAVHAPLPGHLHPATTLHVVWVFIR